MVDETKDIENLTEFIDHHHLHQDGIKVPTKQFPKTANKGSRLLNTVCAHNEDGMGSGV